MFDDVLACVAAIHAAGRVHRDLKPANVLWMLQSHCWRIIDLGIAARAGAKCITRCVTAIARPLRKSHCDFLTQAHFEARKRLESSMAL